MNTELKTYVGKKTVKAMPMPKGEAFDAHLLRDDSILTEDRYEPGYKVVYPDGYESWSPANTFESAYNMAESPYNRIRIEIDELLNRGTKLHSFINNEDKFKALSKNMQAMMLIQDDAMADYYQMLTMRSAALENNTEIQLSNISFGMAITLLKKGFVIRRSGWNGKNIVVFKQVPAEISSDIIPRMQSLPKEAKNLILATKGEIDYTSQCLIYNTETGRADSWVPSISDVFAEDWEFVTVEHLQGKELVRPGKNNVAVDQYDKSGNFIQSFSSISEAEHSLGLTNVKGAIYKNECCGGFIWTRHGEPIAQSTLNHIQSFKVYQYDQDGVFVKEFLTKEDAALSIGYSASNSHIGRCTREPWRMAKGFYWRTFKQDKIKIYKTKKEWQED